MRARINFPFPGEEIWKMIVDAKLRTEWDKTLRDFEVLDTVDDKVDTVYFMIKVQKNFLFLKIFKKTKYWKIS